MISPYHCFSVWREKWFRIRMSVETLLGFPLGKYTYSSPILLTLRNGTSWVSCAVDTQSDRHLLALNESLFANMTTVQLALDFIVNVTRVRLGSHTPWTKTWPVLIASRSPETLTQSLLNWGSLCHWRGHLQSYWFHSDWFPNYSNRTPPEVIGWKLKKLFSRTGMKRWSLKKNMHWIFHLMSQDWSMLSHWKHSPHNIPAIFFFI